MKLFRVARRDANIPIFLLWSVLTAMTLMLQISSDVFQANAPRFPLGPFLLSSALLGTLAVASVLLMARRSYPESFSFYQPFIGGDTFTAMQILGYLAYGCGIMIDLIFWEFFCAAVVDDGHTIGGEARDTYGVFVLQGLLTTGGILMAFGSTMLAASIDYFSSPPSSSSSRTSDNRQGKSRVPPIILHRSPADRSSAVVVLLAIAGNIISPFVALQHPLLTEMCVSLQLLLHLISGSIVHFLIGWRHTPKYRLFMPFPGGSLKVAFAQGFSWLTYGIALQALIFLYRVGGEGQWSHQKLLAGVSALSFVSICSMLLFVRTVHLGKHVHDHSSAFLVRHGRFTISIVATVDGVFLVLTAWALLLSPPELSLFLGDLIAPEVFLEGLRACQCVSGLFLMALPPLTHSLGLLIFPDAFDLWAPFVGPAHYVVLQSLGWVSYTIGLVLAVVSFSTGPATLVAFSVSVVFTQLLIHASLHVYDPDFRQRGLSSPVSSPTRLTPPPPLKGLSDTVSGELTMSVLLMCASLCLRLVADMDPVIPARSLLLFSLVMFTVAPIIAHISSRFRGAPILSPFKGSPEYVALQAVGWTLYALVLIVSVISVVEQRPLGGLSWSSEALLQFVPFSMIALSSFVWDERSLMDEESPRGPLKKFSLSTDARVITPDGECIKQTELLLDFLEKNVPKPSPMLRQTLMQLSLQSFPKPSQVASSTQVERSIANKLKSVAHVTVASLCIAAILLYFLAAYFSSISGREASSVVLAVAGALCATMTCGGVHVVYGQLMHSVKKKGEGNENGGYRIFMPFSGGTTFVVLQGCGWGAYSTCMLLTLAYLFDHTSTHSSFVFPLAVSGVLAATSQLLILRSVTAFNPKSLSRGHEGVSLFEQHAEGTVVVLLFLATFTYHHAFDHLFSRRSAGSLSPISVLVSMTCMMLALPLSIIALRKAAVSSAHEQHSSASCDGRIHEEDEDLNATPKKRRGKRQAVAAGDMSSALPVISTSAQATTQYLIMPFMGLLPILLLYIVYFMVHQYTEYATILIDALRYGFCAIVFVMVTIILSRTAGPSGDGPLVQLRIVASTCLLYMIPTVIVLPSYLVPMMFPCRGTIMWSVTITLFTLIPPPFNRKLLRPMIGAYVGFVLYDFLRRFQTNLDVTVGCVLIDIGIPLFWFLYSATYKGNPEEHGMRRSPWFVRFMKRHFFDDACKYFSLRVISEPEVRGALNDSSRQYIFGFHPHGVFPATAMYMSETDPWRKEMGWNIKTCTTCHGATIIFNGPLLRDFVMGVGGRSVTKRGIEQSIDEGNSVVIVTGGQAELILTSFSESELHLVSHHTGFIRLAIRKNVPMVPVIVFNENNVLDNVHLYKAQKWFLKILGFPFPLVPTGRWHLPLPKRSRLTIAVGKPIAVPSHASPDDEALVHLLAEKYFAEVRRLFESRKAECGLPNMKLHLHHGLPPNDPRRSNRTER